jgi:hypothetical protein
MLSFVAIVINDISQERIISIIRVARFGELGVLCLQYAYKINFIYETHYFKTLEFIGWTYRRKPLTALLIAGGVKCEYYWRNLCLLRGLLLENKAPMMAV